MTPVAIVSHLKKRNLSFFIFAVLPITAEVINFVRSAYWACAGTESDA